MWEWRGIREKREIGFLFFPSPLSNSFLDAKVIDVLYHGMGIFQVLLCLSTSYSTTDAAHATLSDVAEPTMGMRYTSSHRSR